MDLQWYLDWIMFILLYQIPDLWKAFETGLGFDSEYFLGIHNLCLNRFKNHLIDSIWQPFVFVNNFSDRNSVVCGISPVFILDSSLLLYIWLWPLIIFHTLQFHKDQTKNKNCAALWLLYWHLLANINTIAFWSPCVLQPIWTSTENFQPITVTVSITVHNIKKLTKHETTEFLLWKGAV